MQKSFIGKYLDLILSRHSYVLASLVLLAFLTRFFTLFPSVIGHDESTYRVIGSEWLRGNLPFVSYIDIKPLGIYGLFAIFTFLFGKAIAVIRVMTILTIAFTGYFLYRAKLSFDGDRFYALAVGALYVMLISIHYLGWPSNTEIFFVFFTAIGLWVIQHLKSTWHYFLFGLIMGLGFIFKYHVLFDTVAFGLYLLVRPDKKMTSSLFSLSFASLGFLIPFGCCFLGYYMAGYQEAFMKASFEIPSNYNHYLSFGDKMGFVGQFYVFFPLASLSYLIAIIHYTKAKTKLFERKDLLFFLWPLLVWVAILMTGQRFYHYYVQALLPFCFFNFDGLKMMKVPYNVKYRKVIVLTLFIIILSFPIVKQYKALWLPVDSGRVAADFLAKRIDANSKIYTSNKTILYYLLDKRSPTAYVHASLIYKPSHISAFGINQEEEFNKIKAHNPDFIITENNGKHFLVDWLVHSYTQVMPATGTEHVTVWERNDRLGNQ